MRIDFNAATLMTLSILTGVSCGKPDCVNTNRIFNEYKSDQIEYKNEIIKLIESDKGEIEFWFNQYVKKDNGEFIEIQISAYKTCAKAFVRVIDWKKMEGIKMNEGRGYTGAELVGLKFTLEKDSTDTYFLYNNIEKIVD